MSKAVDTMEERKVFLDPHRHLLMLPERCMNLALRSNSPVILDPQSVDLLWQMADDAWQEQFPRGSSPLLVRFSIYFSMLTLGLTRVGDVQTTEPIEEPYVNPNLTEDPCFPKFYPQRLKWDNALVLSRLPNDELDDMKRDMGLDDSTSFQEVQFRHLNDATEFAIESLYEGGMALLPEGAGEEGLDMVRPGALDWVKEMMGEVPEGLHAAYVVDLHDGGISYGEALRDEAHNVTAIWYQAVNYATPMNGGAPVGGYLFGHFEAVLVEPTQDGARLVVTVWKAEATPFTRMSSFTEALRFKADGLGGGFGSFG